MTQVGAVGDAATRRGGRVFVGGRHVGYGRVVERAYSVVSAVVEARKEARDAQLLRARSAARHRGGHLGNRWTRRDNRDGRSNTTRRQNCRNRRYLTVAVNSIY